MSNGRLAACLEELEEVALPPAEVEMLLVRLGADGEATAVYRMLEQGRLEALPLSYPWRDGRVIRRYGPGATTANLSGGHPDLSPDPPLAEAIVLLGTGLSLLDLHADPPVNPRPEGPP